MITIVDPNNKILYTNTVDSTNQVVTTQERYQNGFDVNNSVPYEKMFIYASLKVRKRKNTVITSKTEGQSIDEDLRRTNLVNNSNNQYTVTNDNIGDIVFDLSGYKQNDKDNLHYSNEVYDYDRYPSNEIRYEGIGIKDITLTVYAGSINRAEVTILDTRMGQLFENSPYEAIFAVTPPPEFELTLKGYYGQTVTYIMNATNFPKITFSAENRVHEIKLELASVAWKPLTMIYGKDILTLPFLKSSGRELNRIDLQSKIPPKSFYEFIVRGRKFYSDLIDLKKDVNLETDEKTLRQDEELVNKLLRLGNNYALLVQKEYPNINQLKLTKQFQNNNRIYIVENLSDELRPNFTTYLKSAYDKAIRQIGFESTVRQIGVYNFTTLSITEINGIFQVSFNDFFNNINAYGKTLSNKFKDIQTKKIDLINKKLESTFGNLSNDTTNYFIPTANNIIKLICDDVDSFFNILHRTNEKAEEYHKNNFDIFETNETNLFSRQQGFVDGVHSFPVYAELQTDSGNVSRLIKKALPQNGIFSDWEENNLLNDYYDASIILNVYENNLTSVKINNQTTFTPSNDELLESRTAIRSNKDFEILRDNQYNAIKILVDTYVKGYQRNGDFAYPYNLGTSLFSKFKFVDRALNDIGDKVILDFKYLTESDLRGKTVYEIIVDLLRYNNFEVTPYQSFILFDNNKLKDAFEPIDRVDTDNFPIMLCQYIGGKSEQVNSDLTHKTDSFSLTKSINNIPPDMLSSSNDNITGKLYAFRVGYGEQNQSYFKDINISVNGETFATSAYIDIQDEISKIAGKTASLLLGQSYYDLYSKASFKATVTMLGCMMIQPSQYFEIDNLPIYSGTYMIQKVKHSFNSNNEAITVFEGFRIGKFVTPIVETFYQAVDIFYDSVKVDVDIKDDSLNESRVRDFGNFIRNTQSDYTEGNFFNNNTLDLGFNQISLSETNTFNFQVKQNYNYI